METVSATFNSIIVRVQRPTNTWVNQFVLKYQVSGESESEVKVMDFNESNEYLITALQPNKKYQISVAYRTGEEIIILFLLWNCFTNLANKFLGIPK